MANDNKLETYPLDPDSIAAAFNRKGVKRECPRCGRNDWSITAGRDREVGPMMWDAPDGLPDQTLRCVALVCKNCGFLDMHMLPYLFEDMGTEPAVVPMGNDDDR